MRSCRRLFYVNRLFSGEYTAREVNFIPKYKYKAVSLSGENINGEYIATDKDGVVTMLRQGGYYPLAISQMSDGSEKKSGKKIKIRALAGFCMQMSAMLRAGVPIAKTLEILKTQTEDLQLRKILDGVYTKVLQGTSLYDAFLTHKENFPLIFLNMVEAGEESGTLDVCLERAGVYFARNAKLNGKIKSAMIYPIVLIVLVVAIVALLLIFVIPTFTNLFKENNVELPGFTQVLLALSDFVINRWYLVIIFITAVVLTFRMWLKTDKGRTSFDYFKLQLPVLNKLLIKIYSARFSRTLSSMSAAGVPITKGLNVAARSMANRFIEKKLYDVVDGINRGEELSKLLEQMAILPPMIVYMVRLGEESGTMDTLLNQAADFYDDESENAIQSLTALMEPAMIVGMALIVLPVILAVILPVFNMYNLVA